MPPTPRRLILNIQEGRIATILYPSNDQGRCFAVELFREALASLVVLPLDHFLKLHFAEYRSLTVAENNIRNIHQNALRSVKGATKESEMYAPLVHGINLLCITTSDLVCIDTHAEGGKEKDWLQIAPGVQVKQQPDAFITSAYTTTEGASFRCKLSPPGRNPGIIIEIKISDGDDCGWTATSDRQLSLLTLGQLDLMLQEYSYVALGQWSHSEPYRRLYGITVAGRWMRFWAWGPSGSQMTERFDYQQDARPLFDFLHAYDRSDRGHDIGPSMMFRELSSNLPILVPKIIEYCRSFAKIYSMEARNDMWFKTWTEQHPTSPVRLFHVTSHSRNHMETGPRDLVVFAEPIWHSRRMAGRGTRCYLAVDLAVFNEPTSTLDAWINSKHPILECLHLLKTSWQSPLRTPEFEFHHRISQRAKELRIDIPHMATMLAGGRIQGSLQSFGPVPEGSQPDRNAREIHWILLKETGRPLGTFNDSKQLLQAIEDTAVTIRQLSRCDVVHRDVSINNVLINVLTGRGLLVDFDAARDDRAAPVAGRPGITGTPDFLALALESQPLHAVWHDYESLYWVSVFAILRHMPQVVITHRDRTHNLDNSLARAECMDEIFGARTQPPQMSGKYDFLREADYVINNNMAISSYMERTSSHLEALYNTFAKIKSIIKQLKSILSSTLSSEDNSSDPSLLSGPYDPLEELQVWTPQQHSTLKWLKNYTNANHHGLKGERDVQDHLTTLLECCDTLACLSGRLLTDTQAILVQDRITQIRSDISSLPHISFPGHGLFSVARFRAYGFSSQAAVPYRVPFQTDPMERMRLGVGRLTAVTPYERRHRTGTSFSAFTGDI